MLAKPQGFPRKLGGCAGLDPRLRSAVSAGVGDGERGLRRGLRAPGVGVRPKWVLEYSPSNKRIRYFVSITYVRTGLWTAHKFCGGGKEINKIFLCASASLRLCDDKRRPGSVGTNPHISPKGPEKAALSGIKRLSRTFHKPNKGGPYDDRV